MIKKRWINLALVTLCAFGNVLNAEIEQITVTWNAFKCQNTCIQQIEQHFTAIKAVRNFEMNPTAGSATMGWDNSESFSYEPFRYASAAVGIHIITMSVRVKGFVSHSGDDFFLNSDQDNTQFKLIGPIHTEAGRYTPNYNLATRPLPQSTKDKLLEIEKRRLPVIIEGPLFLPSRYPRTLITEQIKVIEPKEPEASGVRRR